MNGGFPKIAFALLVILVALSFTSFAEEEIDVNVDEVESADVLVVENLPSGLDTAILTIAGAVKSEMYPLEQVVDTKDELAKIRLRLFDDFGSPVSGHEIQLISSGIADRIFAPNQVTNANGEIVFDVISDQPGVFTYSAYDITDKKVLSQKAKVVYFDEADFIFANDYSFAAVGNSAGPIDKFEFAEILEQINAGSPFDVKIKAVDSLGQTVLGYTGTVRFSAVGANSNYVTLPSDYIFTTSDQGEHVFALAFSFAQPGTYNLEVRDIENFAVFGEKTFIVQQGGGSSSSASAQALKILTPLPGTSSNTTQVISGIAPAGSKLKIFDNDKEIASVVADVNGQFAFTTPTMSNGAHQIYVAQVNDTGTIIASSAPVAVTIDTVAPVVSKVELEPSDSVSAGSVFKVKLFTAEKLSKAAAMFQNNIYDLNDSGQGFYEAAISAPIAFGNYPIDIVITDQLGNETKIDDAAMLKVGGLNAAASTLGDVTGLTVTPSDHRVTLNWQAPSAFTGILKNYRVFYGISPNQLTEAVDTFTNATTWYVANLKNGTEYYFAVVAVDDKGNVSPHFSNIVSAVPNPTVVQPQPPEVKNGTAGAEAIEEMQSDVSETGPEIWWIVVLSLVAGYCYNLSSKRRDSLIKSRHDFD